MDMLIALASLPVAPALPGLAIRKPIGPEHELVAAWIARHFTPAWASEARAALANRPVTLLVATRGDPAELLGFCACDATARGFVGPIGVLDTARRTGIGAALLLACLHDMRAMGYGYAVAGAVGAPDFFRRVAGAIDIPGSTPGMYAGMLRAAP
ncbi:MAG: GNAT family N-acetyltransferase [Pseudorhodoferax sp.]